MTIFSKSKINFYLKINDIFKNFMKNNENNTLLHRWCNNTSPIYKDKCNWEKKLELAQLDNCYTNNFLKKNNFKKITFFLKVSKNKFITNNFFKISYY